MRGPFHFHTFGRYRAARAYALRLGGVRRIRRAANGSGGYVAVGLLGEPLAYIDRNASADTWQVSVYR